MKKNKITEDAFLLSMFEYGLITLEIELQRRPQIQEILDFLFKEGRKDAENRQMEKRLIEILSRIWNGTYEVSAND